MELESPMKQMNGEKEGCSKYGNKPTYYSMGRAASPQSATAAESRFKFSLMTLSSWDYSVTSPEASLNLSKGIVSIFKVRTLYLFLEGQYYDLFKVVVQCETGISLCGMRKKINYNLQCTAATKVNSHILFIFLPLLPPVTIEAQIWQWTISWIYSAVIYTVCFQAYKKTSPITEFTQFDYI